VVDRGVAEAADHDRIIRRHEPEANPALEGERHAERSRQVRGDGAGLRHDAQRLAAEHLVAAAAAGIFRRGDQRREHRADRIEGRHVACPLDEERAVAVVQHRRVGRPRQASQHHAGFVARGTDGVVAFTARTQLVRCSIQMPREQHRFEQLEAKSSSVFETRTGGRLPLVCDHVAKTLYEEPNALERHRRTTIHQSRGRKLPVEL
jgi:hypothetical protein